MEKENSYRAEVAWKRGRNGLVSGEGIVEPTIRFSAPVEFKGDNSRWTPEHFLVAAVVSCFVVTFSAMAESSKLNFLKYRLRENLERSMENLGSREWSCDLRW